MEDGREEMLRATFNQAAVAMAVATLDGHFTEMNKRFTEFIGYSPKELAALTFLDITHPADVAVTRERLRSLKASPIDSQTAVAPTPQDDGPRPCVR